MLVTTNVVTYLQATSLSTFSRVRKRSFAFWFDEILLFEKSVGKLFTSITQFVLVHVKDNSKWSCSVRQSLCMRCLWRQYARFWAGRLSSGTASHSCTSKVTMTSSLVSWLVGLLQLPFQIVCRPRNTVIKNIWLRIGPWNLSCLSNWTGIKFMISQYVTGFEIF